MGGVSSGPDPAATSQAEARARDLSALALTGGALLLGSPLRDLWAGPSSPWWMPFLGWCLLVLLGVAVARVGLAGRGL
jgi:hypothetical protein